MKEEKWSKDQIKEKILNNQNWLERGIVAIYNYQTYDEQQSDDTKHHNDVGFSSADARLLSYYAKYILKGNHLTGVHIERAKKKMTKYAGQLTKIANKEI